MLTRILRQAIAVTIVVIVIAVATIVSILTREPDEPAVVDLGRSRPNEEHVTVVMLKNESTLDWPITAHETSCGCTSMGDLPAVLKAKSSFAWRVTVRAPAGVGGYSTNVSVSFANRTPIRISLIGIADAPLASKLTIERLRAHENFEKIFPIASVDGRFDVREIVADRAELAVSLRRSALGKQFIRISGSAPGPGETFEAKLTARRSDGEFYTTLVLSSDALMSVTPRQLLVTKESALDPVEATVSTSYSDSFEVTEAIDPKNLCSADVRFDASKGAWILRVHRKPGGLRSDVQRTSIELKGRVGKTACSTSVPILITDI